MPASRPISHTLKIEGGKQKDTNPMFDKLMTLARPALLALDPEKAHELTLALAGTGALSLAAAKMIDVLSRPSGV